MMLSHNIPLNDEAIARAVHYVVRARKIAGPRLLFGNGTRIINILHAYDPFNNLFASGSVIRKELGLGARAQEIWTFQGPTEMAQALKAIANSKGPTTIYIYAHGFGQSIRLSDFESLELSDLAKALKLGGKLLSDVLVGAVLGAAVSTTLFVAVPAVQSRVAVTSQTRPASATAVRPLNSGQASETPEFPQIGQTPRGDTSTSE